MAEILHWLRDVRQHAAVSKRRKTLREPGAGVDYGCAAHRGEVEAAVERLHPKRMKLRVLQVRPETPTTKTLVLERVDGPLPPFRPGQYVNLFVEIGGVRTSRAYSIASPPGADQLELTVRDKPGGFVAPHLLEEVGAGDVLECTGPQGSFVHEPLIDGQDLVLLAGGSGITPFMSMIREAVARDLPLQMHLLYGCRVPDDVIFEQELAELEERSSSLRVSLVISEPPDGYEGPAGFLDAATIREQIGYVTGRMFYLCGPGAMLDLCRAALAELEVPRHRIRTELYGPPDHVTAEPGWPEGLDADQAFAVEVGAGKEIVARAGEPLMNSLERHHLELPAVCRSGECSYCRTRLVSGTVFQPPQAAVRESDRTFGFIHPCVAYPIEDLVIELPGGAVDRRRA